VPTSGQQAALPGCPSLKAASIPGKSLTMSIRKSNHHSTQHLRMFKIKINIKGMFIIRVCYYHGFNGI
jgi:hypothetical protein